MAKFFVVKIGSRYNAIIGRLTLHALKAVISSYHLTMKFPAEHGVRVVRENQQVASPRQCYVVTLKGKNKEPFNQGQSAEDLISVPLDEAKPEKTTQVKLSVNLSCRSIQQKKRNFALERWKAIKEEVDKLLDDGFIGQVYYPEWLFNMVMVKKANGKWCIYIDFTYLNKAYPKDNFPLPMIDHPIVATTGYELLSFVDSFSGYNQIKMHPNDEEKKSFITEHDTYY
ncbi:PREDICTED: uncharacterized protein LOC104599056 [Nelumbo nucifera]|uniref:Uncharacterized protein LOC104599056 n=1 Tax=Nelumbo nucifera TaxID=4432 RepID=A0A1U8AC57_NELNU|nr:PREDICTED: uncharacterized protein LOC104599056 [Nelumbo nucifera]